MEKPISKPVWHLDYQECEKYIAHKLGIKDLRDVKGKFADGKCNYDVEYQDFWHCIMDNQEINNGCYIRILSNQRWPEWAIPIVKAFQEEFEDVEYWVEW